MARKLLQPGIFKIPGKGRHSSTGDKVPDHYFYAEQTLSPGEDRSYPSGWVETVGAYMTWPNFEVAAIRAQSASNGMNGREWKAAKHRRVSWDKVPTWWKAFFAAHLDDAQYAAAKKTAKK